MIPTSVAGTSCLMYINEPAFNVFLVGSANRQRLALTGSPSGSG